MTVTAPAPAHRGTFHPLRVAEVERLTADAVAVTFEVPDALRDRFRFAPGQHVTVRADVAGEPVRRNYSLCSPPDEGRLRIAVKRLPGGAFSAYAVERLRPGAVLDVLPPTGRFGHVLVPGRAVRIAAIAAGSGITPVLSILGSVLAGGGAATLVYGNRTAADVMFLDELADLKDRYPSRFALQHVLSREPQEAELLSGRIDGPRLRRLLDTVVPVPAVQEWFLCGPWGLVEQARSTLVRAGVDPGHVHSELFHAEDAPPPAEPPQAPPGAAVTVTLDGRASTLTPAPGERILDAVLRVRPDAPYACRGGVCGTCRARLVAGQVRMERNFALEPDELAAGYVLACQSHPASPQVGLDFDA